MRLITRQTHLAEVKNQMALFRHNQLNHRLTCFVIMEVYLSVEMSSLTRLYQLLIPVQYFRLICLVKYNVKTVGK